MKHLKYLFLFAICLSFFQCQKDSRPAFKEDGSLNWMTMPEAAGMASSDKPFFIDVYTDWCGWCKKMDKGTFTDEKVKNLLAEHFHVVKFNAENKEPIEYKGQTYTFAKTGRRGSNGLARVLLNGRLSYPSFVYLDKDLNPINVSPGYKDPAKMTAELERIIGKLN